MGKITIHHAVLEDYEQRLLERLCRRKFRAKLKEKKTIHITVEQMERLGWSGARLFYVFFDKQKTTLPYVLKIHKQKKIESEVRGIQRLIGHIDDVQNIENPVYDGTHGALLELHFGQAPKLGAISDRQLAERVYKVRDYPVKKLLSYFDKLYAKLAPMHKKAKPKALPLLKYYSRYLRAGKSKSRIESILGNNVRKETFDFLGANIFNPLIALERLQNEKIECKVGLVHGDLHPRNVIFDSFDLPHLIDFAWAQENGPILVDFVLLENSLRFLLFPRICCPVEQLKVDRMLLYNQAYARIRGFSFSTRKKRDLYLRLVRMVSRIRKKAWVVQAICHNFQEYLLSQFIVLHGLLSYDGYADHVTVRALGLIAKELSKNNWGRDL